MKTSESTIQIRVDTKTKEAARKTLDELGLDLSSAVKLFLRNVIITQSIPMDLRTANGFTIAQEKLLLAETATAKKSAKRHQSLDTLFADLDV